MTYFFCVMAQKRKLAAFVLLKIRHQLQAEIKNGVAYKKCVNDDEDMGMIKWGQCGAALATMSSKRYDPRAKPINQNQQKELWSSGFVAGNWIETSFKARVRFTRDKFEFILNEISSFLQKIPTKLPTISD